jgi:shikimate dehydrogenase
LAELGLEGSYTAREVSEEGVHRAFEDLRRGRLDGFNVTMPHKRLAAGLCDRLDPLAERAGSVNTVVGEGGQAVGYTTDVGGITDVWSRLPATSPVLVLGTGGAAAAALIARAEPALYLAARRFGAGTELGIRLGLELGEVRWGTPVVEAVVVNCTPLGMGGEELPAGVLDLASGLLDMAYRNTPTPAVARIRAAGRPVVEGLDLLVAQAARSFTLFTGHPAPVAVMRAAAENR